MSLNSVNAPLSTAPDAAPGIAGTAGEPPKGYENHPGAHFNVITQRWELPQDRPEIAVDQSASTMPDADGTPVDKPSFKDQVNGFSKKFAGKLFGKDHEVAMGNELLAGQGRDQAERTAEEVKQQTV